MSIFLHRSGLWLVTRLCLFVYTRTNINLNSFIVFDSKDWMYWASSLLCTVYFLRLNRVRFNPEERRTWFKYSKLAVKDLTDRFKLRPCWQRHNIILSSWTSSRSLLCVMHYATSHSLIYWSVMYLQRNMENIVLIYGLQAGIISLS